MLKFGVLLIVAFALLGRSAHAADESAKDAALKELQEVKELLDAQKKVLDAQKDLLTSQKGLLDAQFPKISGGKEGTIEFKTGSADSFHAQIQAYKALKGAASEVCTKVDAARTANQPVVLLSADDVKTAAQYRIALADLENLKKAYEKTPDAPQIELAPGLALYGAALALTTVADFTKLFRANRALYAETTSIDQEELANLLAQCLCAPSVYPAAQFDAALASGESAFLKTLRSLDDARAKLDPLIYELEAKPKDKRTQKEEAKLAEYKALAIRHDTFAKAMTASDEATKTPNLFYLLRGEIVAKSVQSPDTTILLAKISKQGGFSMVTSTLWLSDRLYSSGGVIVSYKLVSRDRLLSAGSVPVDSPLIEVQKVP